MLADKVPPPLQDHPRAAARLHDPDERFTFRKPVREMPSSALEELLSAQVLKVAKEKFNARPWAKPDVSNDARAEETEEVDYDDEEDSEEDLGTETAGSTSTRSKSRSRSRSKSVKREDAGGDERMDIDAKEDDEPELPPHQRLLQPTISTDDDLSYSLMRPSVRHILAKLDATLRVLHNAQEATLNYQSDSTDSEASDSSRPDNRRAISRQRSRTPATRSKTRGRPPGSMSHTPGRGRSRAREYTAPPPETDEERGRAKKKGAGRPRKTYPRLEGETDREFAIRVARLRKEPNPIFSDDDDDDDKQLRRDSGNSGDGEETAGPSPRARAKRKGERVPSNNGNDRPSSRASSTSATGKQRDATKMRTRVGLRDWRDVLGAAALAGFPADAVDRAARRCADLFGQSMVLHTLPEAAPPARRGVPGRTTAYVPGMPYPPLLEPDEEDEGEEENNNQELQLPIRPAPGGMTTDGEAGPSRTMARPTRSRSVSRPVASRSSRSRSVGSAAPYHTCTVPACPRATEGQGFARKQNLVRHLRLVHGVTSTAKRGDEREEVDSEDEMHGAVHVDGFLKTITMRQGWRAGDMVEGGRRRRRSVGGYGRRRESGRSRGRERGGGGGGETSGADDEGDVVMGGGGGGGGGSGEYL